VATPTRLTTGGAKASGARSSGTKVPRRGPGRTDRDASPDTHLPAPGRNLLDWAPLRRLVGSRAYPLCFQIPVTLVFGLVAFQLIGGPDAAHDNAGTALMWVLWWPILPVAFVLLGRFWCAVCPFGLISDVVQRLVGANQPVPRFLKTYGIWIIDAQFLLITWADHVWGIVESPWGSGVLLLLLTTAVIVSGAFFQRRTFCRYLCFLGGLCSNYGRAGAVELRADTSVCATCTSKAACYNGVINPDGTTKVAACPLFSFPRTMDTAANCNLCGNCIKACPNDAIGIHVRKPTSELWFVRDPKVAESFLAMAIMGIVLIQNITMLGFWNDTLAWIENTLGVTNYAAIFTVAFAVAVSFPVALLAGASLVASRKNLESTAENFARFGYAMIVLDVAAHVAHNLFHLLAEGGSVFYTVLNLFGAGVEGSAQLVPTPVIQVLQFTLIVAGTAGSLYAAKRLVWRRYRSAARRRSTLIPVGAVIVLLGLVNVYLFTLPMAHRM
jgi:polyferredoxin